MIPRLAIFTSEQSRENDGRLEKLAGHLGIESDRIPWESLKVIPGQLADPAGPFVTGAMSSKTLGRMIQATDGPEPLDPPFLDRLRHLLVYDFEPDPLSDLALRSVTSGSLVSVSHFAARDHHYAISSRHPEIVGELGGLTFGPINYRQDSHFDGPQAEADGEKIISIGGKPFFVQLRKKGRQTFLVANNHVIDADERLETDFHIRDRFSGLLPYIMFFRHAFGDYCWHNRRKYACFIIDDPLLKKEYGFLNCERLTRLMSEKRFKTAIAFIPWNYRRTNPKTARYFLEHKEAWSLCVHGCDHTAGEFASDDIHELRQSVAIATDRMNRHEQRTGLGFDSVMVFPQGLFSTAALKALKANDYLAAANSSIHPRDVDEIRISDYLELALSRHGSFPVFLRRYPRDIAEVMIGLFLGKPALLVEHQEYFKNEDDDQISDFVEKIHVGCPEARWATLAEIALRSHLMKRIDERRAACRIYAHQALVENDDDRERTFVITKREEDPTLIKGVLVNGRPVDHDLSDGQIEFTHMVGPGETITVRILYDRTWGPEVFQRSFSYELRVLGRRVLSEFRDEFLSRHDHLFMAAKRILSINRRKGRPDGRSGNQR